MADVDYYVLLGISRSASSEQIKNAYRKKARECHPDRTDTKGTEAFRLITRAYEILSDPDKREEYDKGFKPVTSIADLYSRRREGKKIMEIMLPTAPAAKQIGPDLYMEISVGTEVLLHGGTVAITLPDTEDELILQIPPRANERSWCRLPHKGSSGRNGADSGDLWIQLKEKK
jgi:DnaJ-class molecular chaperone